MTLRSLRPADFAAFFAAVHGVQPFPWQDRLLHQVADQGKWPQVLDLPTGTGKTAAIDIAVFHLALDASRGSKRRAPVRIAYVVDRRLIVDDAYGRAYKLQMALAQSTDPIVAAVASALRSLAGDHHQPALLVRRLRGGAPREDDWARTPVQPTILCSTVDQVGSRLLFRGYGISDRMKPVQAGLLGSDCLLLLDEAHLAEPFRQMLQAMKHLRGADHAPWDVALLTATPGTSHEAQFHLGADDRVHPVLSSRLKVPKRAALIELRARRGHTEPENRIEAIAEQAKAAVQRLSTTIRHPAVGVVVNRVARARAVFERLEQELPEAQVMLVIGPARAIDREQLAMTQLQPIRTGAERSLSRPFIVVATQTIEAGVDIDFDGLITEAAALDALRQRFGRLNRAGRPVAAEAVIVAHLEEVGPKADDPVYGDRIAKTWEALKGVANEASVDFGIEQFPQQLIERADELVSPKSDAPVLLPRYVDLWSHTSPIPNADPEVSLFLHGPDRKPASIQIVWRADIDPPDLGERERMIALLTLVPPRSAEAVEVPLWVARAWLQQSFLPLANLSDAAEKEADLSASDRNRRVFRYGGADSRLTGAAYGRDLKDGDLIVVPANFGGCDEWGWKPEGTEPVTDVGDNAAWLFRARRFAVRVTPELLWQAFQREPSDNGIEPHRNIDRIRHSLCSTIAEHAESRSAAILLEAVLELDIPDQVRSRLELLRDRRRGRLIRSFPYGDDGQGRPKGVVFTAPLGLRQAADPAELAAVPTTESDDLGLHVGAPQLLTQHSEEVRDWATNFCGRAGMDPSVAADVALASYLHDIGKADPRFQAYLAGGDPLGWDENRVLAKSGYFTLPRGAWERSGLPSNWRHEALSVRLARTNPSFATAHDPDLVLWLIGVHHGFGRPLFPHNDPQEAADRPGPQSLAFDFNGRDWAQLFEELRDRYGSWGLARLEAFVRLADHRASEAAAQRYNDRELRRDE